MTHADLLFLVVLTLSVITGWWRGLLFEVFSLLGWVLAFWGARSYADEAARVLPLASLGPSLQHAAGFAAVFLAVVFAGGFLAWLARQGAQAVGLRPVDRLLGALFGSLRGVLILLALTWAVHALGFQSQPLWQESVWRPWLEQGLLQLSRQLPFPISESLT